MKYSSLFKAGRHSDYGENKPSFQWSEYYWNSTASQISYKTEYQKGNWAPENSIFKDLV